MEKSKADRHLARKNGIGADLEKSKRDRQTARKNAFGAEMQKNFADRPWKNRFPPGWAKKILGYPLEKSAFPRTRYSFFGIGIQFSDLVLTRKKGPETAPNVVRFYLLCY